MQWTEQQYERVAQYLDGDPIELTAAERDLAEEIENGLSLVTAGIDPHMRRRAMDKARRRMSAALVRPRRRKVFLTCFAAAEAVAVAAVLVVAFALQPVAPPAIHTNDWAHVPLEVIGPDTPTQIAQAISLVRYDIDLLEADMLLLPTAIDPASFEIDELQVHDK